MIRRLPSALGLLGIVALFLATSQEVSAQDPGSIASAKGFLGTNARAKDVLSYVHFGASYDGQAFAGVVDVINDGRKVPGHFALVYDYTWEKTGETRIAYLCNAKGQVYTVQIVKTNAILSQPFGLANLSIKLLGNLLLEGFKKQLNEDDSKMLRQLIEDANAKGLLEASLVLQQTFGR